MKTYMPLNGLRWSRNSGSANCDMPQSAVFGQPGGGVASNFAYCRFRERRIFDGGVEFLGLHDKI